MLIIKREKFYNGRAEQRKRKKKYVEFQSCIEIGPNLNGSAHFIHGRRME
jgi:hypothetical protein